jgi:hypothetical protein
MVPEFDNIVISKNKGDNFSIKFNKVPYTLEGEKGYCNVHYPNVILKWESTLLCSKLPDLPMINDVFPDANGAIYYIEVEE